MKSWITAVIALAATGLVFFLVTDPLFDAAASEVCGKHGLAHGYVLIDAQGHLGYRPSSAPDFSCTFEDGGGRTVFVDENDGVVEGTAKYLALRFSGWILPVVGAAIGMIGAAKLGLIGDD